MITRSSVMLAALLAIAVSAPMLVLPAHSGEASERRALFREGARIWPSTCGGCHKARPAGERSPAEWDTIMMHMQVRANLPGRQAKAIREFLKAR